MRFPLIIPVCKEISVQLPSSFLETTVPVSHLKTVIIFLNCCFTLASPWLFCVLGLFIREYFREFFLNFGLLILSLFWSQSCSSEHSSPTDLPLLHKTQCRAPKTRSWQMSRMGTQESLESPARVVQKTKQTHPLLLVLFSKTWERWISAGVWFHLDLVTRTRHENTKLFS